jgi:cell division GTPase FtsZ
VSILLLSLGGGGGNILRSVKRLFHEDLAVCERSDPQYAEQLRRNVATRFLDTNRFSLLDLPVDEQLLIGAQTTSHLGSRHDPVVARRAFDESKNEIENLLSEHAAVIIIATGGKGTGAGTIAPVTELARQLKKLVIPIFVRPSFERHEVEKRRFDHALAISEQFDRSKIRFIEILNDRGYVDADPRPQSIVWERMNVPVARALRGLLYVLSDLSQVDPSDLSSLFAGQGRLRVGFAEIDPPAGADPSDELVDRAVRQCWENAYCNFGGPAGTSLICLQGQWSNVADAKIKSQLAAHAVAADSSPYNPLYARAFQMPKPWGITALFAEYTGDHVPVDVDWTFERTPMVARKFPQAHTPAPIPSTHSKVVMLPGRPVSRPRAIESFWELALAVNRSDPAALALAQDGEDSHITVDLVELRKLIDTVWFRSAFPRFSKTWQERLLSVLSEQIVVPNHVLRVNRQDVQLCGITHGQLKEAFSKASVSDEIRADLRLLMAVANLWGEEGLKRLRFAPDAKSNHSTRFSGLLRGYTRSNTDRA